MIVKFQHAYCETKVVCESTQNEVQGDGSITFHRLVYIGADVFHVDVVQSSERGAAETGWAGRS